MFQDMYSSMYRTIDMLHRQDPNSSCGFSDSTNGLWRHEIIKWGERKRWMSNKTQNIGLIKRLREQTGAPISDVKSALEQANWDLGTTERDTCIDWTIIGACVCIGDLKKECMRTVVVDT